ncbi:MAG TPA: metalloregulator ArsR/SmtB family transcription factor, partial [Caulobacteraceae bacterium]|nr:metalloregulator ArsR/SmtB family transcription factor [Caulobacteraceae bacterium]
MKATAASKGRSVAAPKDLELQRLEASAAAAARLLKLLASEQRLILLCRLSQGESSVGELAQHVGLTQSAASQHLAKLRADGLVATRREAQTIYYRLDDEAASRVIDLLCDIYGARPLPA